MCNPPMDTNPSFNPFIDSRKTCPFTMIVAISAILNILLIYALHKTSRPFNKPATLFFWISFTDLLNTLLPLIEKISNTTHKDFSNRNLCFFITFIPSLRWLTAFFQVILLGFLSSLRFISIYRPLVIITTKKLTISLVIAFTLSCALNLSIFVMDYVEMQNKKMIFVYINENFLFIMILYTTIINTLSYTKLKSTKLVKFTSSYRTKDNEVTTTTTSTNNQTNDTSRSARAVLNQRKAVVTLLILTTLYWICCAPLITLYALWPSVYTNNPSKLFLNGAYNLYYSYSGINSMVYILRTKKLKEYFCSVFKNE